jgi:hypothetical protein
MNYFNSLVPPPNYHYSSVPPPHSIPQLTTFKTPPSLYIKHILYNRNTDFLDELVAAQVLSQKRIQNTEVNTVFEDPETFSSGHDTNTNISFIVGKRRTRTYQVEKIEKNTWDAKYIGDTFPIFQCVDTETGQIIYHFNIKLYQEKQKQYDRRTRPPSRLGPVNRFNTPHRRR